MTAQIAADLIRREPSATDHYGLTVIELGEEGGTVVVLGHHHDRRTLAALNRYARRQWGDGLGSEWGHFLMPTDVLPHLQRVRAIVVHACHRGWNAEDGVPAADMELVEPGTDPCRDCLSEVGATWALLYRDDVQDHPAAFPVTVWEYDQ